MALVLYLTGFIFAIVYSGEPLVDLIDQTEVTKAAFYDFDKTLLVESLGGKVKAKCVLKDVNTSVGCSGAGDMVKALQDLFNQSRIEQAFGGAVRIARLKQSLETMVSSKSSIVDSSLFVLSTSYEPIPAVEWEDYIFEIMQKVELDTYFPRTHILGLDDPGPGIQADKGGKAKVELDKLGITNPDECIFADDKQGNLNWAYCEDTFPTQGTYGLATEACDAAPNNIGNRDICNTLLIQERAGMDYTDFNYFEARVITIPCGDESGGYGINCIKMAFVFISSLFCILIS